MRIRALSQDFDLAVIEADLNAAGVVAFTTMRNGGVSRGAYAGLNLGDHVNDDASCVAENRARLAALLPDREDPLWLSQVHGTNVVPAHRVAGLPVADAAWTDVPGQVCVVLTADCLPVVFAARDGSCVAVAHAGWRGLAAGVLEATIDALPCAPRDLVVWLGPAIGPNAFEVGPDVIEQFADRYGAAVEQHFMSVADVATVANAAASFAGQFETKHNKYLADLYGLARLILKTEGVERVTGGDRCTFCEHDSFFSYRRDGDTGRMATIVYRTLE